MAISYSYRNPQAIRLDLITAEFETRIRTPVSEEDVMAERPTLRTNAGMPVFDNQNTLTSGPRGPVLMQDFHLLEKLAHQNRERIPERTVHAKGSGAYGTLGVTHDVT